MRDLVDTLTLLNELRDKMLEAESLRQNFLKSNLPQAMKDEQDKLAQQQMAKFQQFQEAVLQELVRFPPHKIEHFAKLKAFHANSPYDKSVFVMTKFPGNGTPLDQQLEHVIQVVRDSVTKCGHVPHLACDKQYNPLLWKNVEFYLLGCRKGIAIVESKHTYELNPNVTMEWGWMRGMDREVLFLVEKTFDLGRADLGGLIQEPFVWDKPEADIEKAVAKFLT